MYSFNQPGFATLGNENIYYDLNENIPGDVDEIRKDSVDNESSQPSKYASWKQSNISDRNKVTHVGFLKVHKAGSTTMQNLFFRFGLKHKLNIAIPKRGNHLFNKNPTIRPKYSSHYDIFACHTVYKPAWFSSLLPDNTIRIAIIREPFDRMVSAAYYNRDVWNKTYLKNVPTTNFIQNLVQYPEKYETSYFSPTKNSMGKDFGFTQDTAKSSASISHYMQELDKDFALVMVTEMIDHSLVLMRRLLNWSIADIIYLPTNAHPHEKIELTDKEWKKFRKTNFIDIAIYDYFYAAFKRKVEHAGKDLTDEVNFFQNCLAKVRLFCDAKNEPFVDFERSKWDDAFRITRDACTWMNTDELAFISQLRELYH